MADPAPVAPPRLREDPRFSGLSADALEGSYSFTALKAKVALAAAAPVAVAAGASPLCALVTKIVASVLVGTAAIVGGVLAVRPGPPAPLPAAVVAVAAEPGQPPVVEAPEQPVPAQAALVVAPSGPVLSAAGAATRKTASAVLSPSSTLAAELARYEEGMRALAVGDFVGAVWILEEHSARWPQSVLSPEVSMSRLDALLRAERFEEARSLAAVLRDKPAFAARQKEIDAVLQRLPPTESRR